MVKTENWQYLHSKLDEHWLKRFWNTRTFIISWLRTVWLWKKIKVNIISTWCIPLSETVTVPSFMTMASTVSEESLANDRHSYTDTATQTQTQTHARTHTHGIIYGNFLKVFRDFENEKKARNRGGSSSDPKTLSSTPLRDKVSDSFYSIPLSQVLSTTP